GGWSAACRGAPASPTGRAGCRWCASCCAASPSRAWTPPARPTPPPPCAPPSSPDCQPTPAPTPGFDPLLPPQRVSTHFCPGMRPRGRVETTSGGGSETPQRSEEHTSELQSRENLVCRLLLEKKK